MKLIKLTTKEDFLNLKKNDKILIHWNDSFLNHTQGAKELMFYNIYQHKKQDNEIICQKKYNHYFNYKLYLEGNSAAIDIYKVETNRLCDFPKADCNEDRCSDCGQRYVNCSDCGNSECYDDLIDGLCEECYDLNK